MDSLSLSNSISKETKYENTELSTAYFEDLKGRGSDAISNERIQNGDRILETYEVTSDAISGGMGSVWRVHHQSWNTDLAMKRPQPRYFAEGSDKRKEQFIRECEHWIDLGLHPNIVSCYYVREIGGVPTIFSEWMDGGSLSDRIKDGSLYKGTEEEIQKRILDIAIQAARGLQYSHEYGLIHQDFKPGNLLLTQNWDAKIADFGLAKAKSNLNDKSDTAKTTGYTLAYCPQEQVDREEPQKWMDIYSWALTVLEMYAGKRLWNTGAQAKEHIDEYVAQCVIALPNRLTELLRACLTGRPEGFSKIRSVLTKIYSVRFGKHYEAELPEVDALNADNLNNKALSMIDLGKPELANEIWVQALSLQPDHIYAVLNQSMYLWSIGQLEDNAAIKRIQAVAATSEVITRDMREGVKWINNPIQFYKNPATEKPDFIKKDRMKQWDVDFDIYNEAWIVDATGTLWRTDSATGERTFSITPPERKNYQLGKPNRNYITKVACDRTGQYVFYLIAKDGNGEECGYYIGLLNTEEKSKEVRCIKDLNCHHVNYFFVNEENRLVCGMWDWKWHPFTDEKQWFHTTLTIDPLTPEKCGSGSKEQIDEWLNQGKKIRQNEIIPDWTIEDAGSGICLSHPDFPRSFYLDCTLPVCVSRDGRSFFSKLTKGTELHASSSKETIMETGAYSYLCHLPRQSKLMYRLSKIKDITEIAEQTKQNDRMKKGFWTAMEQEDYRAAIRFFHQYRDLEGKRDASSTVEMEKALSKHCIRSSIHHVFLSDTKETEHKMPFSYWKDEKENKKEKAAAEENRKPRKRYLYFENEYYKREFEVKSTGMRLRILLFSLVKALRLNRCDVCGVRADESQAVIMVTTPKYCWYKKLYLLDRSTVKSEWIGWTFDNDCLFSANGYAWVYRDDLYLRTNKPLNPYRQKPDEDLFHWSHDTIQCCFSPDSRFVACSVLHAYVRRENNKLMFRTMVGNHEDYSIDLVDEPDETPHYSADGFYISCGGDYHRISYNYALPKNPDWDSAAEWYICFWMRNEKSLPEDEAAMDRLMKELENCGFGFLKREKVLEYIREYKAQKGKRARF